MTSATGTGTSTPQACTKGTRRTTAVLRRTLLLGFARGASAALGSAAVAAALWWLRTR
ncbi:hypothetical protein AB0F18_34815 [Streptomyces sp. NPDC029216]|uniref:hypothetical protein n=1 Tax=Streptomyces sp. NPDC029216 TaxID=3154701 RepID=UPI0033FF7948